MRTKSTKLNSLATLAFTVALSAMQACTQPENSLDQSSSSKSTNDDSSKEDSGTTTGSESSGSDESELSSEFDSEIDQEQAKNLYLTHCAICHDSDGQGHLIDAAAALSNQDFLRSVSDEFLFNAIRQGRPLNTEMSAWGQLFGGPFDDRQINGLVRLIRAWQTEASKSFDNKPIIASIENGAELYQIECFGCHGEHGDGWPYASLNDSNFLNDVSDQFLLETINEGRRNTSMPGFDEILSDQQQRDIVVAIRSWKQPTEPLPKEAPKIEFANPILNKGGPVPLFASTTDGFLSREDLQDEFERASELILLDARPPSDWIRLRIQRSSSLPFYDFADKIAKLPRDIWIVIYCKSPNLLAQSLYSSMTKAGFTKVKYLEHGLRDWLDAGYPTESGIPR